MKISDAKKEIEIELTGETQSHEAEFTMKIIRPIQVIGKFDASRIMTMGGKAGINFRPQSTIAKAFGAKGNQDVHITLPTDVLQTIQTQAAEFLAAKKADARGQKAKVWYWNNDNEYYALHITPDISMDFREDLKKTQATLEKNQMRIWDALVSASKPAVKQNWMHDRTAWMEISAEIVEKMAKDIMDENNAKIAARKAEHEAKELAAFAKAKEAGEKQQIRKWTVPCEDREEECSTDIVVEYAMPDGTKKTEQYHTW